jgi:GntR family transcriptional repressor for pyruvate dehydrogenase complex
VADPTTSVHWRIAEEIAAGRADEAEQMARAHLAATQALVLERFDDSIVTVSSEQARRAIQASRAGRAG